MRRFLGERTGSKTANSSPSKPARKDNVKSRESTHPPSTASVSSARTANLMGITAPSILRESTYNSTLLPKEEESVQQYHTLYTRS